MNSHPKSPLELKLWKNRWRLFFGSCIMLFVGKLVYEIGVKYVWVGIQIMGAFMITVGAGLIVAAVLYYLHTRPPKR